MHFGIKGVAEVVAQRRNVVQEKYTGRGASSRRFVQKIGEMTFFCGRRNTGRVVNRKPKLSFFGRFFFGFSQPKTDFFMSVAQKKRNRKTDSFFFGRFFPCPLREKRLYICMENPLWVDTWTASAHSSSSSAAAAAAAAVRRETAKDN